MPLALGPFALRWWFQRPEPMDPAGNPELADLYERLRRIKGWGVWALTLEWVILFSTMAILIASRKGSYMAVVIPFGTAAVAIATGSLMLVYKTKRRRVATLLRELVAETAPASQA